MINFLRVEKIAAKSTDGEVVFSKNTGAIVYNYDVVGELNGREVRAHMDVVEKSADEGGKKGARGQAYANLDIFFGEGENTAGAHLERNVNKFVNAKGQEVETVSYEVVLYDNIGFDMRVPMKPRAATDKVVLDNLIRRQEFIEAHPELFAEKDKSSKK